MYQAKSSIGCGETVAKEPEQDDDGISLKGVRLTALRVVMDKTDHGLLGVKQALL